MQVCRPLRNHHPLNLSESTMMRIAILCYVCIYEVVADTRSYDGPLRGRHLQWGSSAEELDLSNLWEPDVTLSSTGDGQCQDDDSARYGRDGQARCAWLRRNGELFGPAYIKDRCLRQAGRHCHSTCGTCACPAWVQDDDSARYGRNGRGRCAWLRGNAQRFGEAYVRDRCSRQAGRHCLRTCGRIGAGPSAAACE